MKTLNLVDLMGLTPAEVDVIQAAIRDNTISCLEVFIAAGNSDDAKTKYVPSVLFDGEELNASLRFVAELGLPPPMGYQWLAATNPIARDAIVQVLKDGIASLDRVAGRYGAKVMGFTGGGSHTADPVRAKLCLDMAEKLRGLLAKFTEARGS